MKHLLLSLLFFCGCSDDAATPAKEPANGTDAGTSTTVPDASDVADGNTGEVVPPRRVFVTRALRTGANGGTAGADDVCNQEAKTAMLTGTFVAWLSTPTSKAIDKLRTDTAFITTDGKILWDNRADMEAGIGPKVGITADAKGTAVTGFTQVWTGADGNGKPTNEHCSEWTTNVSGATGGAGVFGGIGKEWTQAATPKDCGESAPLLCFESN